MIHAARLCLIAFAALFSACGPARDDTTPVEEPPPEGVYGQAPAAVGGTPSVVSLQAPFVEVEPTAAPVMDQFGLVFSPRRMVVRAGEEVTFKNSESLAHNVHVRSMEADSDVLNVDTDPGDSYVFAFEQPGGYDVFCDIHPGMTAFIYATVASYTVIADDDGNFVFTDVPPGSYTVTVWSVDPDLVGESTVEVGVGSTKIEFPPRG